MYVEEVVFFVLELFFLWCFFEDGFCRKYFFDIDKEFDFFWLLRMGLYEISGVLGEVGLVWSNFL